MKEKELEANFDINNIHSVELNLLDGQIEIILRSLELYGYNLEYMLNSTDSTDDTKQEKLALLKYTYEQVLASQAEQVDSKSNNIDNLPKLGKILIKDSNISNISQERKFNTPGYDENGNPVEIFMMFTEIKGEEVEPSNLN